MNSKYFLSDGEFEIGLLDRPIVSYYSALGCKKILGGKEPVITLYDPVKKKLIADSTLFQVIYSSEKSDNHVKYTATVNLDGNIVVFELIFSLENGIFGIRRNVIKEDGLKLTSIFFEEFIKTGNDDTRIMLTSKGGRLVAPNECENGVQEHRYNWVHDNFCNYSVMYNTDLTAVIELESLDDTLYSIISGEKGEKYGALGVLFRHRYTFKDKPYKSVMSLFKKEEQNGKKYPYEEHFKTADSSSVNIHLYKNPVNDLDTGWVFGARKIHSFLPQKPTDFYKDRFVYKMFIGCRGKELTTSFKQALEVIKKIHRHTLGAKQICYIVGFQHDGHDSKYPDVFTVNQKAGGMEDLLYLMEEAKKYNTIVSFHDNYDDAYIESPGWDEEDIAITNNGELLQGGCWNDIQAYWISLPRYSETKSEQRIERTLAQYPIEKTYHLDVLTASVFRLDFRKNAPKSKEADLEGRLRVVRQFKEKGIDVTSEAIGARFMQAITYSWHWVRSARPVFEGDKRIPAAPFLAHGKADYAGSRSTQTAIVDGLLYGALYGEDLTADTPLKEILDGYYLLQAPLNKIRDYKATDYVEKNGYKQVLYENDTYIKVNYESLEIEVVIDGAMWIKNGTILMPNGDGEYIAYSAFQGEFGEFAKIPIPDRYKDHEVKMEAVESDKKPYKYFIDEGNFCFLIPEGVVYTVSFYKNE